jgi:protein-tyrosine phosphatase
VLAHCALGKSRSAAVVLGYALLRAGWDLQRAAALLHDGRHGGIAVNWGFEAMLQRMQDERDGTAGQRRLRGRAAGHVMRRGCS